MILTIDTKRGVMVATEYHSGVKDTTGLGGTWSGSGTLYDIHKVGVFFVATNPFNSKPVEVWQSEAEMVDHLGDMCKTLELNLGKPIQKVK